MISKILIKLIEFYQKAISQYTRSSCRYLPTCSQYAIIAIKRFGSAKGMWLFVKRFLRCNPFFKGGYDPVPEKKDK